MKLKFASIVYFSLCWLLPATPGHAAQVEIVLMPEVSVSSQHYKLGDIARIESDEAALVAQLAAIVIGKSPRPNFSARLTRDAIAARLEAIYPRSIRNFNWSGPAQIRIRSSGAVYPGKRLGQIADEFVKRQLHARFRDYQFTALSKSRDLLLPHGAVSIKPRLRDTAFFPKRLSVWMDIQVDGEFVRTLPLWYSISIFKRVLVAERDFVRDEPALATGFQQRYVDITRAAGRTLSRQEKLAGKRMRQPLAAGTILTEAMLEPLPEVTTGQKVEVSVAVGSIQLTTAAIALSDGWLSQKIQVRSPISGEIYSVVVTGYAQTRAY